MARDKKEDNTKSCFYWMSLSDLMLSEEFKTAIQKDDKKTVKKILHHCGFDTTKPYEIESVIHRNKRNEVAFGPRFYGSERLDKAWRDTGFMSQEALIASDSDPTMRADLTAMSQQGFGNVHDKVAKKYIDGLGD
jgi:hypothetical protein